MFTANKIDVTRYVALGDSITSGYTDGALCYYGQQNSYPNLIAGQFKFDTIFKQPLLDPESVGIGFAGNSCLILRSKNGDPGSEDFTLTYLAPLGDLKAFSENNYLTNGPFNNMGVPAAKAISLLTPGIGDLLNSNYNPFFVRMAANPLTSSVLSDVLKMEPTFFSLYIGNNDALTFALSGGTSGSITPLEGAPGIGFNESLHEIVNSLTANGAKGVIANIPGIASIPFFTNIPYNGLVLNPANASELTDKYKEHGILFKPGKNPFVISDSANGQSSIRQIKNGEMILSDILLDPGKGLFLRALSPIPKKYILTISEIEKVQDAIKAYNIILKTIARDKGLAFVDVNAMMKNSKINSIYDPLSLGLTYKKRSVFSLDNLHPNAFGQALLANEFIKAINVTYQTNIPLIKSIKYKRKIFP